MDAAAVRALAWDVLRHDFDLREVRILFAILLRVGADGKARLERKFFEKRLNIRVDKARVVCRDLERARVLCPGWQDEEFVLQPNCDLWRRDELVLREEQFVLPLESQEMAVLFAQRLAEVSLVKTHAGIKPSVGDAPSVGLTRAGLTETEQVTDPLAGGRQERRCECPVPRTFPPDLDGLWRERLVEMRLCIWCAVRRGVVRSTYGTKTEKVQRTKVPDELEAALRDPEWVTRLSVFGVIGKDRFFLEVRGQVARGYVPRSMHGWLMSVYRKYENQRKECV